VQTKQESLLLKSRSTKGAVISPWIITSINDKIKAFSSLSEGTKTVIVVVAGLAAAIGPLILR
jgi:hypothetical protein